MNLATRNWDMVLKLSILVCKFDIMVCKMLSFAIFFDTKIYLISFIYHER